jgi:hypothetical protein
MPKNGTLSVSRVGMYVLYPLTGHFPPSYRLQDLSTTTILLNFSIPDIRQALLDCAPDAIITTKTDWLASGGGTHLLEAILATGIYEKTTAISTGLTNNIFIIIFQKTKRTVCRVK